MPTNLNNQANITYSFAGSGTGAANSNMTTTTLLDEYSLTATKTSLTETFRPGQNLTYIFRLENNGTGPLYTVTVADDLGAAEALLSRLWCSFRAEGEDWYLTLPAALQEPLLTAMSADGAAMDRERLWRYDATVHGLLYITGLLHAAQAMEFFLGGVMQRNDPMAREIARRYLQASFDYITDGAGGMILLHPGLANPYQLVKRQQVGALDTFEMSQQMVAGGMNGILPEEVPLHEAMCAALRGALRPELDVNDIAEDLRMLAKQNASLSEMESVLAESVTVLPTREMRDAVRRLYEGTPRWLGLKAALEH